MTLGLCSSTLSPSFQPQIGGILQRMFGTGLFWVAIFVIPFFALVPDITLRLYRSVFENSWYNIVDERDKKLIKKRREALKVPKKSDSQEPLESQSSDVISSNHESSGRRENIQEFPKK